MLFWQICAEKLLRKRTIPVRKKSRSPAAIEPYRHLADLLKEKRKLQGREAIATIQIQRQHNSIKGSLDQAYATFVVGCHEDILRGSARKEADEARDTIGPFPSRKSCLYQGYKRVTNRRRKSPSAGSLAQGYHDNQSASDGRVPMHRLSFFTIAFFPNLCPMPIPVALTRHRAQYHKVREKLRDILGVVFSDPSNIDGTSADGISLLVSETMQYKYVFFENKCQKGTGGDRVTLLRGES
ncbi:hypothetical protein FISHEDRAFT_58896 [Fistulina hepatica ATCC 64428]|uniref:Uncharacterized protein n=1 Tax=Fistulina hepatica ATCC 64428 TaxID=1128425 RepID=A0A0D7ADX1_9AGAR|nr:hypothetical protein FISHEDRAFT_58896 [Fistulina hepatica ATCC 64428]